MSDIIIALIESSWIGPVFGTLIGALVTGVITYKITKKQIEFNEKSKRKEVLFNEKKKIYVEFLSQLIIPTSEPHVIEMCHKLMPVELIANKELYSECQNCGACLYNFISKNEQINNATDEYAKCTKKMKELMRAELAQLLE